jgi:hypothetical protein
LGAVLCALGLGIVRAASVAAATDPGGGVAIPALPEAAAPGEDSSPAPPTSEGAKSGKVPLVVSRLLVCAFVGETFAPFALPIAAFDWDVASDCARGVGF